MNSKANVKVSFWSALVALLLVVALACSSDEPAGPTAEEIASLIKDAVAGAPSGITAEELQAAIAAAQPDTTGDQLTSGDIQKIIDDALAGEETLSAADIQRIIDSSLSSEDQLTASDIQKIIDASLASDVKLTEADIQ